MACVDLHPLFHGLVHNLPLRFCLVLSGCPEPAILRRCDVPGINDGLDLQEHKKRSIGSAVPYDDQYPQFEHSVITEYDRVLKVFLIMVVLKNTAR